MTKDERLWSKKEVAEFLGNVSTRTVERLDIPRVNLPSARGKKRPIVLYDPAEVKAWVAKRKSRTLLPKSA